MTDTNTNSDRTVLDCGKTLDELSTYLAHDRTPYDPAIEECPECVNALRALERVSHLSRDLIAHDADTVPAPPPSWLNDIINNIGAELRAGRDLPLHHPDPLVSLSITEGAVRALIRDVSDTIPGILVRACRITGEADTPHAPVHVNITVSIATRTPMPPLLTQLREQVMKVLHEHTELHIDALNITVENIHDAAAGDDAR